MSALFWTYRGIRAMRRSISLRRTCTGKVYASTLHYFMSVFFGFERCESVPDIERERQMYLFVLGKNLLVWDLPTPVSYSTMLLTLVDVCIPAGGLR